MTLKIRRIVRLSYFEPTGEYISGGEYITRRDGLPEIWEEVRILRDQGKLPEFSPRFVQDFVILVDVFGHEDDQPRLIFPAGSKEVAR